VASSLTLVAGRYRLLRQLGSGGMGRVWLAHDEMLGRQVAVKEVVIPPELSDDEREELRVRTLREARTAARLNHPNVVKIFDVVQSEEQPWIVMEYVPSRSLHQVIGEHGSVEPAEAARVGLAVLAALNAAHEAGVLHRDVKPGNVLLARDGRVVLTDFGLAVFDGQEGNLTLPGLVFGSARYVAPERARDGTSTAESDLWALGATLYAAVEGHAPYARDTAMATLTALATTLPDAPRHAGPLKPVLAGLLRRNPRDRLRPAEVRRLLLRAAGSARPSLSGRLRALFRRPAPVDDSDTPVLGAPAPVATHAPSRPERRVRVVVAAAGAAVVLVATLAVWLVGGPSGPVARPSPFVSAVGAPDPVMGTDACPATGGTALPVASRRANWPSLLPGWDWYLDPSGYRLAVPDGWLAYGGQQGRCFREPGDTRWLGVLPWTGTDPLAHIGIREDDLLGSPTVGGYQRVRIEQVDYYEGAADWEFTFRQPSGVRMHAQVRDFLVGPDRGYTLVWCTRDFDWQPNLDNARLVTASFTPPS
jgi:hypothetical protein